MSSACAHPKDASAPNASQVAEQARREVETLRVEIARDLESCDAYMEEHGALPSTTGA